MPEKYVPPSESFAYTLGKLSDAARDRTRLALHNARVKVWETLPKYNVECGMTHVEEFDDLVVTISVDVKPRIAGESEEDVWSQYRAKEAAAKEGEG